LLFSQLLTLYVTPVFYLYMESLRGWFGRRRGRKADEPAAGERAVLEPVGGR